MLFEHPSVFLDFASLVATKSKMAGVRLKDKVIEYDVILKVFNCRGCMPNMASMSLMVPKLSPRLCFVYT